MSEGISASMILSSEDKKARLYNTLLLSWMDKSMLPFRRSSQGACITQPGRSGHFSFVDGASRPLRP